MAHPIILMLTRLAKASHHGVIVQIIYLKQDSQKT